MGYDGYLVVREGPIYIARSETGRNDMCQIARLIAEPVYDLAMELKRRPFHENPMEPANAREIVVGSAMVKGLERLANRAECRVADPSQLLEYYGRSISLGIVVDTTEGMLWVARYAAQFLENESWGQASRTLVSRRYGICPTEKINIRYKGSPKKKRVQVTLNL